MIPRHFVLALAASALVWCPSCSSTAGGESPPAAPTEKEDPDDEAAEALELRKAQVAVEVAAIDQAASLREAQASVADAERELEDAQRELQLFDEQGMTNELERAQLSLDRAVHRRELEADELAELEAMYAEEDFAEKTKELVLKRGRMGLAFAERSLELARREFALKQDVELPLERRDLEVAVMEAERALTSAREGLRKVELEGDLEVLEARLELEQLEEEDDDDDGDEDAG